MFRFAARNALWSRRNSVVEYLIGNEEAVSSILTGGTIYLPLNHAKPNKTNKNSDLEVGQYYELLRIIAWFYDSITNKLRN